MIGLRRVFNLGFSLGGFELVKVSGYLGGVGLLRGIRHAYMGPEFLS